VDEMSVLTAITRINDDIIYTIRFRPDFQSDADSLRRLYESDPAGTKAVALKLMKNKLCFPQPNKFLGAGFAVVYETFDKRGQLASLRLRASDC